MSYGVSQTEAIRHMAPYIDKILKGAKPGDLPLEKIDRYELIVNLKTARAIGVTVPAEVLKRAVQPAIRAAKESLRAVRWASLGWLVRYSAIGHILARFSTARKMPTAC